MDGAPAIVTSTQGQLPFANRAKAARKRDKVQNAQQRWSTYAAATSGLPPESKDGPKDSSTRRLLRKVAGLDVCDDDEDEEDEDNASEEVDDDDDIGDGDSDSSFLEMIDPEIRPATHKRTADHSSLTSISKKIRRSTDAAAKASLDDTVASTDTGEIVKLVTERVMAELRSVWAEDIHALHAVRAEVEQLKEKVKNVSQQSSSSSTLYSANEDHAQAVGVTEVIQAATVQEYNKRTGLNVHEDVLWTKQESRASFAKSINLESLASNKVVPFPYIIRDEQGNPVNDKAYQSIKTLVKDGILRRLVPLKKGADKAIKLMKRKGDPSWQEIPTPAFNISYFQEEFDDEWHQLVEECESQAKELQFCKDHYKFTEMAKQLLKNMADTETKKRAKATANAAIKKEAEETALATQGSGTTAKAKPKIKAQSANAKGTKGARGSKASISEGNGSTEKSQTCRGKKTGSSTVFKAAEVAASPAEVGATLTSVGVAVSSTSRGTMARSAIPGSMAARTAPDLVPSLDSTRTPGPAMSRAGSGLTPTLTGLAVRAGPSASQMTASTQPSGHSHGPESIYIPRRPFRASSPTPQPSRYSHAGAPAYGALAASTSAMVPPPPPPSGGNVGQYHHAGAYHGASGFALQGTSRESGHRESGEFHSPAPRGQDASGQVYQTQPGSVVPQTGAALSISRMLN